MQRWRTQLGGMPLDGLQRVGAGFGLPKLLIFSEDPANHEINVCQEFDKFLSLCLMVAKEFLQVLKPCALGPQSASQSAMLLWSVASSATLPSTMSVKLAWALCQETAQAWFPLSATS